jgi:hypothetical protein
MMSFGKVQGRPNRVVQHMFRFARAQALDDIAARTSVQARGTKPNGCFILCQE